MSREHLFEDGLVEEVGQPDQRLGVRHALAVDAAERAIHQTATHLALTFVEAPVVEMLQDQEAQHHGRRRPQPAAAPTPRMPPRQALGHVVDEVLVVENGIDPAEDRIPELVAVRQEDLDEAAQRVRPPHHGAPREAGWPQSPPRVSCVAARAAPSRRSLTIACALGAVKQIGAFGRAPTPIPRATTASIPCISHREVASSCIL